MKAIDEITIYNPAGSPYIADDGGTKFPITDSCERTAKIMGEDCVRLVFNLKHKVTFDAFSFIEYNGQAFFLKERYVPKSVGGKEVSGTIQSARYAYDVKFVSVANMLDKFVCYRHVEVDGQSWNEPEININGTLETLYVIIMGAIEQAASRLNPAWFFTAILHKIAQNGLATVGGVVQPNTDNVRLTEGTQLLTFNFSGEKIANVCTTVANNFTNDDKKDTEWYITPVDMSTYEGATLHFAKCVKDDGTARVFRDYMVERDGEYLAGELKSVDYVQEWSGIPEVIVPYGSDRNMSYRSVKAIDEITQMQSTFGKRLRLQPNKTGSNAYKFTDKDGNPVTIETDANGAIRNSLVTTGIEVVKFFDEIYPQCHFKVTSVSQKNKRQDGEIIPEYTVEAVPVDNDGNTINREDLTTNGFYPIKIEEATTLSVRFESGLLNGREFEIANKTSKDQGATTYSLKFTIVADGSIEDGTLIPSGNFIPCKDDTFALFNMKMPDEYVTYAELELAKRAYEELITLQSTRPEIKCESDETIFDEDIQFGDVLIVYSDRFDSDEPFRSRVISYSYKLSNPRAVTFNLASAIMQGTLSSMNDLIADVTHTAGGLEQRAINLSRRGWRDASEVVSMLDSLTADVVLVGNGRYQFGYAHEGQGVEVVHSTVGGETRTTAIKISHGTIEHTQEPYVDWVSKGFWEVSGETKTTAITENGEEALTAIPDTPLYLYAVVNENDTLLVTELTSIAHDADEDEGYLLMGILSSEFEGRRVFSRTNGYTSLEGGTITTEVIQDAGRNLIIDFQSNHPRIIARNGAEIIGNITFKSPDGGYESAESVLARLGIAESNAINAAYVNVYIYGDVVFKYVEGSTVLGKKLCVVSKSAILTSCIEDNGFTGGAIDPFNSSCLVVFRKGKGVTTDYNLYGVSSDILGVYDWGEKFDVSEDADVYVFNAQKDYIEYCVSNSFSEGAAFPSGGSGVWTIKDIMIGMDSNSAIKNAVAAEEDARTEALAGVISDIAEIQKQIDGEVSSYFYPNVPIVSETDESVRTDIEPMVEWLKNYTLIAGAYVLNADARNELINNLGDTFTNTEEYVDDTTTPLAGKSWRWCDATSNPSVTKYITVQYNDEYGMPVVKKLHWHIITDTDALRALEAAANAQATADGKCTTFLEKPTKGYNVGDLWILEDDNIHPEGKKGDILTANEESTTYVESHWSKKVKYTDDTALENMEIGGRNLLRDSAVFTRKAGASDDYSFKKLIPTVGLQPDTNYVFSVDKGEMTAGSDTAFTVYLFSSDIRTARNKLTIPISSTRQSVSFKTTAAVTDTDVVLIYAGQQGTTAGKSIKLTNIKLEKGTKATDWSPAPEDVDAKVSALDYLKKALENDTDVIGGIVATTHISLRDWTGEYNSDGTRKYKVNAGLSGVKDDNILLFGGGSYDEAVNAASSPTYDKGDGNPITSLLKKDGTGKIGIFKISETQAIVDVPNLGEVVIDAVDGVSVKDKSKVVKALVTPKTMSEAENDIKSATFVNAEIDVNDTYNISTNGFECSKVLWSNPSAPALSVINGTLKVTAKFKIDLSRQSADNHWIRMIVSLGGAYGFKGMTGSLDITSPFFYQGYFGGEDDREMTLTANCTFTNAEAEMLDEIRVRATMYAEDEYHEIIDPTYSFEPNVEISAKIELATDEKINNSQYSIMAKDGFLSMSGKKMFKVLNGSGGTQKIFAKGLSGAKGDIGSGELYISSDFIQAFRELCDVLEDFFPLARTIGSNATNAEQCIKKVQAVRNALKTTSIIASS